MRKTTSGFTIVELLIVIVVIGILAAITTVAYNGITTRALNAARLSEMQHWQEVFDVYYATNGRIPSITPGNYCLGTDFPDGKCRDYLADNDVTYYESDNANLMAALKSVGNLPSGPRKPVNGTVGPYVNIWPDQSGFTITDVFKGKSTDCPSSTTYTWDDGNGRLLCQIDTQYY